MSASVPADLPAGDSLADSPLGIPSLAARSRSVADVELARLLEHPAIWRGRSAARAESLPTGFGALDSCLPGGGWPRTGLIEILVSRFGVGELYLLFPALAALTRRPLARWCVWISPPLEPYAPALIAHGAALERMLVVRPSVTERPARESPAGSQRGNPQRGRAPESLWAFEQTLGSGASDIALAWAARNPLPRAIQRLQLAAERGKTLGVLFRPRRAARESSAAVLRIMVEPKSKGVRVTLLKSRGGARGAIDLEWVG